ncbi:MAG: DUF1003 domain-containing protein [Alphaproteobacteria bacterium]|nr:DUF1003 domain-containing protein [Alphaproteobacteria bacterium]
MATRDELIANIPLFQLLDAEERASLAAVMRDERVTKDAIIFRTGEPGDETYIVASGQIELFITDKLGQKITLIEAGPGDFFGEVSMFAPGPRTATARVMEDAELLVIGHDDMTGYLRRKPDAALDILAVLAHRMRATDEHLRRTAARNVNEEIEQKRSIIEHVTDGIAAFTGSFPFLVIHIVWFALWIGWNVSAADPFDPFPFGLLTMTVSLEAIFLSVFVLLSQNRQAEKDRIRSDIEYDVNLKAELEVSHLHEKVDDLQAAVLTRLGRIETQLRRQAPNGSQGGNG